MKTINTYYKDRIDLEKFVNSRKEDFFDCVNSAVLVQVFSGLGDKNYLNGVSRQLRELIPHAQVIGTTTSGEIMNGLVSGLKTVISFSIFRQTEISVILAEKDGKDDYELGQFIAESLNSSRAKVLIMFATGKTVKASRLLKGIQSINPDLPVAGGNAGDNRTNNRCFVSCNEKATDHGAVGVMLESDTLTVMNNCHLGWQPIGKEMMITRAEGSRVYTIDHIPAYQVYCQYLGISDPTDILKVVEFPLILVRHGINVARAPFLRYDDDSLGFFGDIAEGEKVRFSFGHVEMIIGQMDRLLQIIKQQPVESIFIYSCASRRGFLQGAAQIETLPLQRLAPTAGFFTSGEFFHTDGSNQLLNTTMTTLALSESGNIKEGFGMEIVPAFFKAAGAEFTALALKDNVADRSIDILRALTCLVNTVTSELNEKTNELQTANEQLLYAGSHDPLTGLYNRGYFRQAMKQMEHAAVGFIVCDVDGLKFINDSFGHVTGDTIIQATADILQALFGPEDVVARIGGDEFCVLMPDCSPLIIDDACLRIRNAVAQYNVNNAVVPLSISIGSSCRENKSVDIITCFKEADSKMYQEKQYGRQNMSGKPVHILMKTLKERRILTKERNKRMQELLMSLALNSGISESNWADLYILACYHDIGEVGIANHVLSKPGSLTLEERKEIEKHCEIGYRIARSSTELEPIADLILKHHEWWNGQGYPMGLKGEDIPVECRIIAILDAYTAMISERPYGRAMSREDAIEEIRLCAGTQFDPSLVEKVIDEIKKWMPDNTP